MKRVAILANGGDVAGFNAVIRAIVKTAENKGIECYGIIDGYNGLLKNDYKLLSTDAEGDAVGILPKGGSIIGSSTNANVFNYKVKNDDGTIEFKDLSDICVENVKKAGFDCVFTLGGDGTQKSARDLSLKGINVIGVPKTIDNDVACTEITFGYNTAVSVAANAIDRLHSTGETHHRIMVLEVMGRYAGWIALESAIAGGADVALIPEIPYDINRVAEKINNRRKRGKNFSIVVVAEGAAPKDGELTPEKAGGKSSETYDITVTELINGREDNLGIENYSEIIGFVNSTFTKQYASREGNYKFGDDVDAPVGTNERDNAGCITQITPSTGENRSYTIYIVGVVMLVVIAGGIIVIKKFVI